MKKKNNMTRALLSTGALAFMGMATSSAQAASGESIIKDRCLICHTETGDAAAPFSRISQQRKTPEGWLMTISRMQQQRGLVISPDEKRELVKYLADKQGLAPSETENLRYVLEKEPNVVESFEPLLQETCVRCHSGARIALQRRTEDEWKWLVHFHMGQQPTAELHAGARDRAWFDIALNQVAPYLGQKFNFDTDAWQQWQAQAKQPLSGRWAVHGFLPEKGNFDATMQVTMQSKDHYQISLEGNYADGSPLAGQGKAVVYTGYEWRGTVTVGGVQMRQVFAASADGQSLVGRMYPNEDDVMGGQIKAVKKTAITAITPSYIKQGEQALLTVSGYQLNGKVNLGSGLKLLEVVSKNDNRWVLKVQASPKASVGTRHIKIGNTSASEPLAVYDQLARVEITPNDSIARVGGGGGKIPKQKSVYRAVGYAAGADGKVGTLDDLRLGYMTANWSLKPFDETAVHDNDIQYAGQIDARGIFTPGDAGPNPARKMSTNNVGNLGVVGTVQEDGKSISGESHLLVTVQKFVRAVIE
ncbi:quinohemoprotein amine dehydrogenase, alpha subunit [Oceanospirillum multiglobuliferum]|nr:quinohemoprotein amine dehydrogenase, alpha subunit [Oceanospirillum multiglobuliferum]